MASNRVGVIIGRGPLTAEHGGDSFLISRLLSNVEFPRRFVRQWKRTHHALKEVPAFPAVAWDSAVCRDSHGKDIVQFPDEPQFTVGQRVAGMAIHPHVEGTSHRQSERTNEGSTGIFELGMA